MAKEEERAGLQRATQPETAEIRDGEPRCDACGSEMKPMGHCKYWCLQCGFLRTCNDVI